ncbi:Alkaline phosphatase synthesis transcriptional regulatory protein PhoP [Paraconexibacter sp. AEG42_29]|uniref:Alkaline phosphatase synthesis transcriptional regulatory protein PhoP n=1 Tax=Paraconexibacter sp. AEG42_29 TaxID=2997339 RepID=A0AAU7AXS9_9ACTN
MTAPTILVVEDDAQIGTLVRAYLERDGYRVVLVRSGEAALVEVPRHAIALVILDLGLPGIDGIEVCRRLPDGLPVIMLTARDEEVERILGLEVGADDYVTKPFSPRELVARVRAVLRRTTRVDTDSQGAANAVLSAGDVELRTGAREVTVAGDAVTLTQREFDLLAYLLTRAGLVVGRDELLEAVWGFLAQGQTRTVDVHVAQLRSRLGRPELIQTVRGVGYKLVAS